MQYRTVSDGGNTLELKRFYQGEDDLYAWWFDAESRHAKDITMEVGKLGNLKIVLEQAVPVAWISPNTGQEVEQATDGLPYELIAIEYERMRLSIDY